MTILYEREISTAGDYEAEIATAGHYKITAIHYEITASHYEYFFICFENLPLEIPRTQTYIPLSLMCVGHE